MNLRKKSEDPRRLLTWNNKSLMSCSRDELMDCVIHTSQQLAMAQYRMTEQQTQITQLSTPAPVPAVPAKPKPAKKRSGK